MSASYCCGGHADSNMNYGKFHIEKFTYRNDYRRRDDVVN